MNLHFVCTGNVFRSRLAQAYAKSILQQHPEVVITSSGVNADHAQDGPIAWYALKIADNNNLIPYISQFWTQTTSELLNNQDTIIFMETWHLEQCRSRFFYQKDNYQVWEISDVTPTMTDNEIITFSENQFHLLKTKVEDVISHL